MYTATLATSIFVLRFSFKAPVKNVFPSETMSKVHKAAITKEQEGGHPMGGSIVWKTPSNPGLQLLRVQASTILQNGRPFMWCAVWDILRWYLRSIISRMNESLNGTGGKCRYLRGDDGNQNSTPAMSGFNGVARCESWLVQWYCKDWL